MRCAACQRCLLRPCQLPPPLTAGARAGDTPVRVHPLAAVAAVVRRRSCLRPVGLELFLLQPGQLEGGTAGGTAGPAGPFWDAPSAFFAFR